MTALTLLTLAISHPAMPRLKPLLIAGCLAATGLLAQAQNAPPATGTVDGQPRAHRGMMRPDHGGPHDPAKMQAMMDKRMSDFKARLKIEPTQESAWTAWASAVKPPADGMQRRETIRAEMQKLTTPERIDKMKALRTERQANMDKRGQATKEFYAQLNPEQKKLFDSRPMMRPGHGHPGRPHGERRGDIGAEHGANPGHSAG